jgi:hypothetical protein
MAPTAKTNGIVLKREEWPFQGARGSHAVETKKMVAFLCPENVHFGTVAKHIEECKADGHDPYFNTRLVKKVREKTRAEGDEIIVDGVEEYYIKVRIPNWEQVVHDIANDSGQLVQRRLAQGWVYPEDIGYAPFCDYMGCSAQNPKYRTPVGTYHLRDEAAIMYLTKGGDEESLEGTAIFVDDTTSGRRRRKQLNEAATEAIL